MGPRRTALPTFVLLLSTWLWIDPPGVVADSPTASDSLDILDGMKSGDLIVEARGAGEARVNITIRNATDRRLRVVLPAGLVAAAAPGQGQQSMGLGAPATNPGGFGASGAASGGGNGLRSMPTRPDGGGVILPSGQTVKVSIPSVCLDYGKPTPTARHVFRLMDVEDYADDSRVVAALRGLGTIGTSRGVAQAVAWHVCNGVAFETMANRQSAGINAYELALAARFVEALDGSSTAMIDRKDLVRDRVLVRITGEGPMAKEAARLGRQMADARVLGLPIRVVGGFEEGGSRPATMALDIVLTAAREGRATSRVSITSSSADGRWRPAAEFGFRSGWETGEEFAMDLGRAILREFVSIAPARNSRGAEAIRVTNRLPMTLSRISIRAGKGGEPTVIGDPGIGPARGGLAQVPTSSPVLDSVELNGL